MAGEGRAPTTWQRLRERMWTLRRWARCQGRETPVLQELKDKRENPMKEDRKANPFIRSTRLLKGLGNSLATPTEAQVARPDSCEGTLSSF